MDIPIGAQFSKAIESVYERLTKAEQALNRNGFKQGDDGNWNPPKPNPIFATMRTAEAMIEQLTQERDEAIERAQTAEQLVTDMVDELNANDVKPADPQLEQVVSQAKVRALWPEPGQMNFTLERRDPMSFQERHTEFKRRSTDIE